MKWITLYYIQCTAAPTSDGSPYVIVASSEYEVVRRRRDGIARSAQSDPGVCSEPHPIHHKRVALP